MVKLTTQAHDGSTGSVIASREVQVQCHDLDLCYAKALKLWDKINNDPERD